MTPEQVRSELNGEGANVVRIPIEERRRAHLSRRRTIPAWFWAWLVFTGSAFVAGVTVGEIRGESHCAQIREQAR